MTIGMKVKVETLTNLDHSGGVNQKIRLEKCITKTYVSVKYYEDASNFSQHV